MESCFVDISRGKCHDLFYGTKEADEFPRSRRSFFSTASLLKPCRLKQRNTRFLAQPPLFQVFFSISMIATLYRVFSLLYDITSFFPHKFQLILSRQRLLLTIILNIIDKYKRLKIYFKTFNFQNVKKVKIKRYCVFNEVFKIIEITKNRVILVDKNYDDDRKGRRVGRRKPLGFFAKVICLLYVPFPFTHHELLPKK